MQPRPRLPAYPVSSDCCACGIDSRGLCTRCKDHAEPYEPTDEERKEWEAEQLEDWKAGKAEHEADLDQSGDR